MLERPENIYWTNGLNNEAIRWDDFWETKNTSAEILQVHVVWAKQMGFDTAQFDARTFSHKLSESKTVQKFDEERKSVGARFELRVS